MVLPLEFTLFNKVSGDNYYPAPEADQVVIAAHGKSIHAFKHEGPIGQIGFSPWRSTMQIEQFAASGMLVDRPQPKSKGYSIPTIDLAAEKHRQVLVDREAGQYLGHVTTV